jgi:hypothetical protein
MVENIEVNIPVLGILSRSSEEMFRFVITFSTETVKASYNTLDDFLKDCTSFRISVFPVELQIKPKHLKKWNIGFKNDTSQFCKTFDKIWKEAAKVTYEDTAMCSMTFGVYANIFLTVNDILKKRAKNAFLMLNTTFTELRVNQYFRNLHGRFKLSFWKNPEDDLHSYELYAFGNFSRDDIFLYYKQGSKAFHKEELKSDIFQLLKDEEFDLDQVNQIWDYTLEKFDEHLKNQVLDIQIEKTGKDSVIAKVYKGKKYLKTTLFAKGYGVVNDIYYFEVDCNHFENMQKAYRGWLSQAECEIVLKELTGKLMEWHFNNACSMLEGLEDNEKQDEVEYWKKNSQKIL